jgi:hypothetical protein
MILLGAQSGSVNRAFAALDCIVRLIQDAEKIPNRPLESGFARAICPFLSGISQTADPSLRPARA